jgi:hypothetical protein
VSLSEDEQSRLSEIEAHARATDPGFVGRLSLIDARRRLRRLIMTLWWVLFLGFLMLTIGLSAAAGVISIGVLVAMSGCGLMAWTGVLLVQHRAWRVLRA